MGYMKNAALIVATAVVTLFTVGYSIRSAAHMHTAPMPEPSSTPVKRVLPGGAKTNMSEVFDLVEFDGRKIDKPDSDWKRLLTADQYLILRKSGTERAYSGALTDNHEQGVYYCAACGLALFSSDAKYDSGTGWPSFFKPIFTRNVKERVDLSLPEEARTEVLCSRCGGHLGHVFDDGPEPTGLRYCMNSLALKFKKR